MKLIPAIFAAAALCLGSGATLAAKTKCELDRSKDKDKGFERAKNEKGKTRKGFYIDKFTDELVVETEWKPVGQEDTRGSVALRSRGENSFLTLRVVDRWPKKTFPTDDEIRNAFAIVPENDLLIGMADGSVLTLHSTAGSDTETTYQTPKPRSGQRFWVTSKVSIEYALDAESKAALMATPARALRVMTDSGHLDIRIEGSGHGEVIRTAARCIAGESK